MRKKAERNIRQAAAVLGDADFYRIDKVRENCDLIRKVFDKTILDMARVGTIELTGGDTSRMSASEIGNFIRQGDALHVYLRFLNAERETSAGAEKSEKVRRVEPETVTIILKGLDREMWGRFESLCKTKEGKTPVQKIREIINEYNRECETGAG